MRFHTRTIVVVAAAVALLALFLRNVDLWRVAAEIVRARPEFLALSLATMPVNLAIRAYRWQYLLEPLGPTRFGNAFRATAVGFAASSILPARAGEVIRPYFLARQARHEHGERVTATGAFATIILERLLDVVTVLVLLASYVFVFGRDLGAANPARSAASTRRSGTALPRSSARPTMPRSARRLCCTFFQSDRRCCSDCFSQRRKGSTSAACGGSPIRPSRDIPHEVSILRTPGR